MTESREVSLTRTLDVRCGTSQRRDSFTYTGAITGTGNALHMQIQGREDLCPPTCLFQVEYALTKR